MRATVSKQDVLRGWIHHHAPAPTRARRLPAPQVCLDLGDDRRGIDSTPLVAALALPADTLVAPLRVAWLPSQEDIDSGPRLRDLIFGDPRHPGACARPQNSRASARAHAPAARANRIPWPICARALSSGHNTDNGDAQRDFADFVARQAVVVLDLAERRLQGGRYKVPRHVAASLMASRGYNEALDALAAQTRHAQGAADEGSGRLHG